MTNNNAVIAVFTDHQGAEAAVKKLADAGIVNTLRLLLIA